MDNVKWKMVEMDPNRKVVIITKVGSLKYPLLNIGFPGQIIMADSQSRTSFRLKRSEMEKSLNYDY